MKKVLVSVVVPVYNVEKYIDECISSVVTQTLRDIEIICVNDGSTDHSVQIIEKYAESDERIKIINQENKGLSGARNTGMSNARGKYIYFMDSDDSITKTAMERLYHLAEEEDLDLICFDATTTFDEEEYRENYKSYLNYYKRSYCNEAPILGTELFINLRNKNEYRSSVPLQFYRKSLLLENNIEFHEGILQEDNIFSLKCILVAKRCKHIADQLYIRRMRMNSIMTSKKTFANSYGYFYCIYEMIQIISKNNYSDKLLMVLDIQLREMQHGAINAIADIKISDVKDSVHMLPEKEQILYSLLVLNDQLEKKKYFDEIISLKEKNKELQSQTVFLESRRKSVSSMLADLNKKNRDISNRNNILRRKNKSMEKEIASLEKRNQCLIRKNEKIRNSLDYKIGKIILFLPRKVKRLLLKRKASK